MYACCTYYNYYIHILTHNNFLFYIRLILYFIEYAFYREHHPIIQKLYRDSVPRYIGIPVFSILIALEDEGQFLFNPQSFKDDRISGEVPVNREVKLIIRRGTIIVFHPMLLHAGGGYGTMQHTRLHFYILPKFCTLATSLAEDGNFYVSTHFAPETKERQRVMGAQSEKKKKKKKALGAGLVKFYQS